MEELTRMQNNLLLIRRAVGWTADEFGEKIGVTRQTINNIENKRNRLTKTVYIAMRSVLEAEMTCSPDDTQMLGLLLDVLVDHPEKYTERETNEILSKANLIVPSILAGSASRSVVSKEMMQLATGVVSGIIGAVASGVVSAWLIKAIEAKGEKK